jgi:hypothetical protein
MTVSASRMRTHIALLHVESFLTLSSEPSYLETNLSFLSDYADILRLPRRGSFFPLCIMRERCGHYSY